MRIEAKVQYISDKILMKSFYLFNLNSSINSKDNVTRWVEKYLFKFRTGFYADRWLSSFVRVGKPPRENGSFDFEKLI